MKPQYMWPQDALEFARSLGFDDSADEPVLPIDLSSPSFHATVQATHLATLINKPVRANILGKDVVASPGDNPHQVYKQWFP
jgi:hypothetical protein